MIQQARIFLTSYIQHQWSRTQGPESTWKPRAEHQLHRHLNWVHTHSPYYAERVSPSDLHQLDAWPTMDKASMQTHFDHINTQGLQREALLRFAMAREQDRQFDQRVSDSVNVGLSSGTSGSRGLFVTHPREEAIWAGAAMAKALPLPLWRRQKVALILRANNPLYENAGGRWIQFRFFDLLQDVERIAQGLLAYQPTLLVAPPSVITQLLNVDPDLFQRLPLLRITSAAEVLTKEDRIKIEASAPCPLHQLYQATEGFLASTCSHGTLHLHEEIHHVEWEPVKGRPHCYTPILTDTLRTTQPHIRYRLNDVLELDPEPCPCGCTMTRIKHIHGRCDDLLEFPGTRGNPVTVFPDLLSRALLRTGDELEEYRITQESDGHLHLALKAPESLHALVRNELHRFAESLHAHLPPVTFSTWTPPEPGQKLRRIQRHS